MSRMDQSKSTWLLTAMLLLSASLVACGGGEGVPPPMKEQATLISGPSPFPAGCQQANIRGTNYENAEVESWLAIDPTNSTHLVGIFQQDRWSNGGAHGLMTAVSRDTGTSWKRGFAHLSRCSGGNPSNGADYERVSDPWVTFLPTARSFRAACRSTPLTPTRARSSSAPRTAAIPGPIRRP